MPPRIALVQCLKSPSVSPAPIRPFKRSFAATQHHEAATAAQRRKHRDPYALAQARARKAANLSRQEVLKKEREVALGDPVRGITTAFVKSFDDARPTTKSPQGFEHLNFLVDTSTLSSALKRSIALSAPPPQTNPALQIESSEDFLGLSRDQPQQRTQQRVQQDGTASEALNRISALSNGSSKDRLRANKQRCVDAFGRHNTDALLPPRPASMRLHAASQSPQKTPRIGDDTGSSEVQIAILTAKIRTLAEFLEVRGKMDKVNKRNLRLLVHKRQKLLRYLRRKERGGPRWENVITALGLTEGTWRGEISM